MKRCKVMVILLSLALTAKTPADDIGVGLVGQWGGATFHPTLVGNTLYFGVGPRLIILDVTDPANPVELGKTEPLDCVVDEPIIHGDLAFVSIRDCGIAVLNVANPTSPYLLTQYQDDLHVYGIDLQASYLYVTGTNNDGPHLQVIDLTDPLNPSPRGRIATPSTAYDVTVVGDLAYVASGIDGGLQIFNISDPDAIQFVGGYVTDHEVVDVAISGDHAYLADYPSCLTILDVSNPTSPTFCSEYSSTSGPPNAITLVGNTVYLGTLVGGLQVFDVSNPCSPQRCGSHNPGNTISKTCVSGNIVYMADIQTGLYIADVSGICSGSTPQQLSHYHASNSALDIAIQGNNAFLADWYAGIQIIDISDPTAPQWMFRHKLHRAHDVDVEGNKACLVTWQGDLHPLDISSLQGATPTAPQACQPYHADGNAYGVAMDGGVAYMACTTPHQLFAINAAGSCSSTPLLYDSAAFGDHPLGLIVDNDIAYVAAGGIGLQLYSVQDLDVGSPMIWLGAADTPGAARNVALSGSHAYVADASAGLSIVDVSVPSSPTIVAQVDTFDSAYGVAISGNLAFVADYRAGLTVVDITNPLQPVVVARHTTADCAQGIAVEGDYVYVANTYGGLAVFTTFPDCNHNNIPDDTEPDCNANDMPDECDIMFGTSEDCNLNAVPDQCDISSGSSPDCDSNGIPNDCVICNTYLDCDDCDSTTLDGCWDSECIHLPSQHLLVMPGDMDADHDIDLIDYAIFQACFTGPDGQTPETCPYAPLPFPPPE